MSIIAVAADKRNITSRVSRVFGRAPYFLIFKNQNLIETVKNPFVFGGGGAGLGVTQMLADKNVDLIIAGSFGQNVLETFAEKSIGYKEINNININEAIASI